MHELDNDIRKPTIVLPFITTTGNEEVKDLFIYLRPESNGIRVESLMFSVIHNDPVFRDRISLVYLANLPGDFVSDRKVIEKHYFLKCEMARKGRECFTPLMITRFEKWFNVKWDEANVISAYDAIEKLNIDSKQLFNLWVSDKDFFYVHGQSVKKVGSLYVINYDIPELLKKNSVSTDIAVMVLRSRLTNRELTSLITKMETALKDGGAIDPKTPPRRCFHYTKSPLEEILDGVGYLYDEIGIEVPLEKISFVNYLLNRGISKEKISNLVFSPIVEIEESGIVKEVYLYDYLMGDSYEEAYLKISKIVKVKEAMF